MPKKKPRQPTRAEREAELNYAKMMAKWDKVPKFAHSKSLPVTATGTLDLGNTMSAPPGRETKRLPSRVTSGGNAPLHANPEYTGDKIIGIATLHKSISTPVFSQQEAVDAATMRRN